MISSPTTIEGKWQIEGKGKRFHYGILTLNPSSGIELAVDIPQNIEIKAIIAAIAVPPSIPSVIFGRTKDNHPVSLYGCIVANFNSSGGLKSYRIKSMVGLVGREFSQWDEVAFNHINAEFSLFHNWMASSNVRVDHGTSINVKIAERKTIESEISDGVKLVIWPTYNLKDSDSETVVSQGHGVEFRFTGVKSAKETLHKYVQSFRRFLTLLVNRPVFIDRVYFQPDGKKIPNQVVIYQSNHGVETADRKTNFHEMLVSYKDLIENFGDVIKRWYKLEESLGDVLNLRSVRHACCLSDRSDPV